VIRVLTGAGYRVVAPDQLGFGKSSKPTFALSFDTLARQTAALLDQLKLAKADILAHSMAGMLGVRFARTYPDRVERLALYAPIGLEDSRFYVPPVETWRLIEQERTVTAEAYRTQLMTNYALPLPPAAIEPFVQMRERVKQSGEY